MMSGLNASLKARVKTQSFRHFSVAWIDQGVAWLIGKLAPKRRAEIEFVGNIPAKAFVPC
jgi:hypothetical protein